MSRSLTRRTITERGEKHARSRESSCGAQRLLWSAGFNGTAHTLPLSFSDFTCCIISSAPLVSSRVFGLNTLWFFENTAKYTPPCYIEDAFCLVSTWCLLLCWDVTFPVYNSLLSVSVTVLGWKKWCWKWSLKRSYVQVHFYGRICGTHDIMPPCLRRSSSSYKLNTSTWETGSASTPKQTQNESSAHRKGLLHCIYLFLCLSLSVNVLICFLL